MPNEGNVCAYPGCTLGKAIAEGAPARYALADPTKWCHKECADRWERFGAEQAAPEPEVPAGPPCGAPHPELHDFTCSKPQHSGDNYHHSGAGHSWYMEPGQVAGLQDAIAKRNAPLVLNDLGSQPAPPEMVETAFADAQAAANDAPVPPLPRNAKPPWVTPKVEEVNFGEFTTISGRNTAEPDIKISVGPLEEALQIAENTPAFGDPTREPGRVDGGITPSGHGIAEPEDPTGEVPDTHQCCEHCNPNGHAPHSKGCPAELQGWEIGKNIADEADTRPPAESTPFLVQENVRGANGVTGNMVEDAVNFLSLKTKAQRANQVEYDRTATVLELVAIFQNNGFNSAPAGLITDLIAWKQG